MTVNVFSLFIAPTLKNNFIEPDSHSSEGPSPYPPYYTSPPPLCSCGFPRLSQSFPEAWWISPMRRIDDTAEKALIWLKFFGDMAIESLGSITCVGGKQKHIYCNILWNHFLAINTLRESCSPYRIHSLDIPWPFLSDPAASTLCGAMLAPEAWEPHHVSLCPRTSVWAWLWLRSSPSRPGSRSNRWYHMNIEYDMNRNISYEHSGRWNWTTKHGRAKRPVGNLCRLLNLKKTIYSLCGRKYNHIDHQRIKYDLGFLGRWGCCFRILAGAQDFTLSFGVKFIIR